MPDAQNIMPPEWTGVDPDELREAIQVFYGGGGISGEDVALLGIPSAPSQAHVIVHSETRSWTDRVRMITPGPKFDQEQWNGCVAWVRETVVEPDAQWWAFTCFQQYRVEGIWQSQNEPFAIGPAPIDFPRTDVMRADHPFLLYFRTPGSPQDLIRSWRVTRAVRSWVNLLNILAKGGTTVYAGAVRHWSRVDDATEPVWAVRGYHRQMGRSLPDQPNLGGAVLELVPDKDYYPTEASGMGSYSQTVLTLPEGLDDALACYAKLGLEARRRLDLATHWAYVADHTHTASPSVFLQALVTSVEAVTSVADERRTECPQCGAYQDRSTARFKMFLQTYGGMDASTATRLYNLRSKVTHGSHLLLAEARGTTMLGKGTMDQATLLRELQFGVVTGLRAWLTAGGPPIEV